MRILLFILLLSLLTSCDIKPRRPIVPSAEPAYFGKKEEKQTANGATFNLNFPETDLQTLAEIFSEDSISPQSKIFWLPDLEEALRIGNHKNTYLLSGIDTVFDLDLSGKQHRLLVFYSEVYANGVKCNGQVCAPWLGLALFSAAEKNQWKLTQFIKLLSPHGSWGEIHPYELCYYGQHHAAIALKGEYMAEGRLVELYRLVDLTHEFGKELFRSRLYASNATSLEEEQNGFFESINEIKWVRKKKYFDLFLLGTVRTNKNGAMERHNDTTLFRYSEDLGLFVPENKTQKH